MSLLGQPDTQAVGMPPAAISMHRTWSVAMLHYLLTERKLAGILLAAAAAHLAVGAAGIPLARCPFRDMTGLPCPGCGLSRASLLLARGRLHAMWQVHPFAPYFALLGLLLAVAAFLPDDRRERWAARWTAVEARTRLHAAALVGFTVFGVARVLWHLARPV